MFDRNDIWKLVSLVAFLSAGLVAHADALPAVLQPAKAWIEFAAVVGGLLQAWRIQPPVKG